MELRKNIIVTGASRGLGLAVVERLLLEDCHIIGVARSEGSKLPELISNHPGKIAFESIDLEKTDNIHEFCLRIARDYGRIYGLVNNAAVGLDGVLATMHESDIERIIRLNLTAPILLCKYFGRGMMTNRCGSIVNVSSIIATTGFSGLSVYGATKAGIMGFTKSLSRELGKVGVRVNSVSPGYMETEMTAGLAPDALHSIRKRSPFKRFAGLEEVANVVAFLLSHDSSAVHGEDIKVDVGSTA